ncbi:NAD-dependent epimerase/dehydratase family protein [soil metagenome]
MTEHDHTQLTVTVLGASGGVGGAITRELATRGHTVTAVNRGGDADVPDGVTRRAGDLRTPEGATEAIGAADVVVMAAQPPYPQWVSHWPDLIDNVLAGAEQAGARLVFVDNLYMYAPADGPITEQSPEHATDRKGALRRQLGRTLLQAHADGRVRVSIGRFSDYYGPRGTNSGLYMTGISAGLRGKTMRGLIDLNQPHTFSYLPDAARAFATLVEQPRADGQAWILPAAPAITQRELLGLVNAQLPRAVRLGTVTPAMLWVAGLFNPLIRETRSVVVQYDRPWVTDSSHFTAVLGPFEVTPHDEAIAATVAWFSTGACPPAPVSGPQPARTA